MAPRKSTKKKKVDSTNKLALPQNCSPAEMAERKKEIARGRKEYKFNHEWKGYPPSIDKLPLREIPVKGALKLVESGIKLEASKLEQRFNQVVNKLKKMGAKEKPFDKYTALYDSDTLPEIGKNGEWKFDAVFAAQRLDGMYPWFIKRLPCLDDFQKNFPITDERVEGLLPKGATLEALQDAGRLYVVSQPSLEGATPAHDHVMTAPTTLFYVSNIGQLMPIAIQLYPRTSPTNPIFTPNDDPNTWLAVKIHAACADTLVHSIYSHAVLMHFVMCNVWTAANRTLPSEHPVHAFLKPHFWSTLFVTDAVKSSMNSTKGSQCEVYGTGLKGQNQMVGAMYKSFDFRSYDPNFDFKARGVDDVAKLPQFYYRDDSLKLWNADKEYVEAMMGLFYSTDADVKNDCELQEWVRELAAPKKAGIIGLPVNAQGKMETREQLVHMLTSVLFTVTSRHSSIEHGALNYLYIPANPFLYRLNAPTESTKKLSLKKVASKLPPIKQAIQGYALIATADFDPEEFGLLGRYKSSFTDGWPDGAKAIIDDWNAALKGISAAIDERNEKLDTPYTGMNPINTFNSIWN